jgi:hypothetical protein
MLVLPAPVSHPDAPVTHVMSHCQCSRLVHARKSGHACAAPRRTARLGTTAPTPHAHRNVRRATNKHTHTRRSRMGFLRDKVVAPLAGHVAKHTPPEAGHKAVAALGTDKVRRWRVLVVTRSARRPACIWRAPRAHTRPCMQWGAVGQLRASCVHAAHCLSPRVQARGPGAWVPAQAACTCACSAARRAACRCMHAHMGAAAQHARATARAHACVPCTHAHNMPLQVAHAMADYLGPEASIKVGHVAVARIASCRRMQARCCHCAACCAHRHRQVAL